MRFSLKLLIPTLVLMVSGCVTAVFAGNPPEKYLIQNIFLEGNLKTKDYIIFRELTFAAGDTLSDKELNLKVDESTENLQRLPLFHFVHLQIIKKSQGIDIVVEVTERWYTWIWPIFNISDRNFNSWLENGDFSRISYGLFLQHENFRGRLEKLHFLVKLGYQQQVSLLYETPYLNKSKTIGAGLLLNAARDRETGYITQNDKLLFHRSDEFLQKKQNATIFVRYRPQIHLSHTLSLGITHYHFSDTLQNLNPAYSGIEKKEAYIPVAGYQVKADFRDNRAYPLKGWYADALAEGFGIIPGTDYNFFTLRTSARVHVPLSSRWNLALGVASKFSSDGLKPFFLNQSLGYDRDYVRGYEYNVIDGDHFWTFKSNFKYALVPERVATLHRIKAKQFNTIPYAFYLGLFADAGQAWPGSKDATNHLPGQILSGAGLGLDFVTYYDKVFRLEFSINREGQTGLFLHFMAAI